MMKHTDHLEQFIMERMDRARISAVSMAVVKDGEVIYERGFGLANRVTAEPASYYGFGLGTSEFFGHRTPMAQATGKCWSSITATALLR